VKVTRRAAIDRGTGTNPQRPRAIKSGFTNSLTASAPCSSAGATVDFPAPFGPARMTTLGRGSLISAPRLPHFVFKLLLQRLHPCYEHIARFLNGAAVSAQLLLKEVGETDVSSRFGVSSRERRLIGLPSEARDGLRRAPFALRPTAAAR